LADPEIPYEIDCPALKVAVIGVTTSPTIPLPIPLENPFIPACLAP
jgi:hypothetical protein